MCAGLTQVNLVQLQQSWMSFKVDFPNEASPPQPEVMEEALKVRGSQGSGFRVALGHGSGTVLCAVEACE